MSKDIDALIERLEKATGPDRELDAAICIGLQYGGANSEGATNVRTDPEWGDDNDLLFEIGTEECCNPIPCLTASVDAALALCERMLPGWRWGIASHSIKDGVYSEGPYIGKPKHVDGFRAHVTKPSPLRPMPHIADARTPALAILLALLRSLNQGESRSEESKNG